MFKEPNLWAQTARWHFLRVLWECAGVCVYVWIHPPPLTPENTPPSKCSWFLFFSLWDKPRRSLQASSLLVFLAAALRKVAFPILVAISRAPGAQLPLPFRRLRRGWFTVLILTSRSPRRNEGEGQDVAHKSRAAFPRRPHSCFWCFNYAPPLPPPNIQLFSCFVHWTDGADRHEFSPVQSALSLQIQNSKPDRRLSVSTKTSPQIKIMTTATENINSKTFFFCLHILAARFYLVAS